MSSMPVMPTTPLIYVDTNGILSAKEYEERGRAIGDSEYRVRGRRYQELLDLCLVRGFRVTTLKFTIAEMLGKYQRWHYYETKIAERAPLDEIFGNSRRDLEHSVLTATVLDDIARRMDDWLANWRFRSLVELCPPNDSATFGSWSIGFWDLVRIIFKHTPIAAPDCLHGAAAVVAGADLFVSNDGGLNRAIKRLYDTPEFKSDAATTLGLLDADISLQHGAHNIKGALNVIGRL